MCSLCLRPAISPKRKQASRTPNASRPNMVRTFSFALERPYARQLLLNEGMCIAVLYPQGCQVRFGLAQICRHVRLFVGDPLQFGDAPEESLHIGMLFAIFHAEFGELSARLAQICLWLWRLFDDFQRFFHWHCQARSGNKTFSFNFGRHGTDRRRAEMLEIDMQ